MYHHNEDNRRETSQKNAAAIRIMIRTGSWAIVNTNIANGGPKAKKVHPKNSTKVIFLYFRKSFKDLHDSRNDIDRCISMKIAPKMMNITVDQTIAARMERPPFPHHSRFLQPSSHQENYQKNLGPFKKKMASEQKTKVLLQMVADAVQKVLLQMVADAVQKVLLQMVADAVQKVLLQMVADAVQKVLLQMVADAVQKVLLQMVADAVQKVLLQMVADAVQKVRAFI
ncbi:hypothetical protein TcasGA2_TC013452 [Tribolium castaneum]|uniref:Uncharacterized protein n=1 Tax=Tribolium castaneum TaxID=7070 RepID=D6WLF0_TRICA|nr:hypothetical protein TcasGA2_TC013452 [Tribolium castaneum]